MSLCDPHAQPNRRQVDLCTYIYISPGPAFVTVVKAQLLSTILQLDSYWRGRSGGEWKAKAIESTRRKKMASMEPQKRLRISQGSPILDSRAILAAVDRIPESDGV